MKVPHMSIIYSVFPRSICLSFSFIFLFFTIGPLHVFSQDKPVSIELKTGTLIPEKRITAQAINDLWEKGGSDSRSYVILQFRDEPNPATVLRLKRNGVELIQLLSKNTYEAIFHSRPSLYLLEDCKVLHLSELPTNLKMHSNLAKQAKASSSLLISILFYKPEDLFKNLEGLKSKGFVPSKMIFQQQGLIYGSIESGQLSEIAQIPSVRYINLATEEPKPLMFRERGILGITAYSSPQSGKLLSGTGITVGVGDNADPTSHIDLQTNLINRSPAPIGGSTHGSHVAGVVSGDGIVEERWTGVAPNTRIISDYFDYIIAKTPTYVSDYGMTVTNNSYFNGYDFCPGNGDYNELSLIADQQIHENPMLGHVFAAGNDGMLTCSPYPYSFGTIKSGYQVSKNVLTVGNCDVFQSLTVNPTSSRGPVSDGRLKPEIMASGTAVAGTSINNSYTNNFGTSASAPIVTGIWSMLSERYKQLFSSVPKSGLLKSILCNTATDKGRTGPDYENGFGWIHPQRALKALEEGRYASSTIAQGQTQSQNLTIPAGTKQVKIMLYWHDPEAAPFTSKALQHDLDLTVIQNGNTFLPWILNPSPSALTNPAIRGVDRLNNIEQITIDNPGSTLEIKVQGFQVLSGNQEYFLTWEFIQEGLQLLYPLGGERFTTISTAPQRLETISWEATDNSTNTFTLEYSLDDGNSWNLISSTVGGNEFRYFWPVPDIFSSKAKVRVSRNGTGLTSTTPGNFTIMGIPNLTASVPCEGYVDLEWNAVPNASDYEIFQHINGTLQKINTTTALSLRVNNLDRNTRYWFSVRPRVLDSVGRRGTAKSIIPSRTTPCSASAFDNDLKIDTLLSPVNGRKFTSSELRTNHPVSIRIKNLDNALSSSNYTVSYQINNGTIITETPGIVIDSGGVYDYTFNANANLSASGNYSIKVWVSQTGDDQPSNNEQNLTILHVDNPALTLPYTENFEATGTEEYRKPAFAIANAERFDFLPSGRNGRLRTYINKDMAISGNRSVVLDATQFLGTYNTNDLTGTFNLSNVSSNSGLRLDFSYRNQGQLKMPATTLWIRGKDTDPWILAYTFEQNQYLLGETQKVWINLEDLLLNNGQTISSSFQIRFNQLGRTSANNSLYSPGAFDLDDGYTFDNIRLSVSNNDLFLKRIVSPDSSSCNGNLKTVRVALKNNSNIQQTNIPVSYRVDLGTIVTEQIPFIAAGAELEFSFSTLAAVGVNPKHLLDVWVNSSNDNYPLNDSLIGYTIFNSPVIQTFPYVEGFENNSGLYFVKGTYESWDWGTIDTFTRTELTKPSNGKKGWFTGLAYNYKANEESYLYTPCFNLSQLQNPVLSFAHFSDQEDNRDNHTIEYSTNQGLTWQRLGNTGEGTNWFDANSKTWNKSLSRWHVSSIDIPTNASSVQFRFLFSSDAASQFEGIGIDDIHIFEKEFIYIGPDLLNEELPVQGNDWTHFRKGGEIFASINPLGQNLGKCSVSVYMNPDPVRQLNNQYYLDRNFVIQSENTLTDSVLIRLYFTEDEVNSLLQASSCPSCSRFTDAFRASVTQYDGPNQFENNILNDGTGGNFFFFDSTKVFILPFNNGYVAEFKARSLSEFWIHAKDFQLNQTPLPVTNIRSDEPFIQNSWLSENNYLMIQTAGQPNLQTMQVRLLNSTGQELLSTVVRYQTQIIFTGALASGIYFIEITDPKRQIRYVNKLKKNN
jgi:hypothetical protein